MGRAAYSEWRRSDSRLPVWNTLAETDRAIWRNLGYSATQLTTTRAVLAALVAEIETADSLHDLGIALSDARALLAGQDIEPPF